MWASPGRPPLGWPLGGRLRPAVDANPFYKDRTTGVIIISAVALSAAGRRRG